MRNTFLAAVAACCLAPAAWGQSNPGFVYGQTPTPAQWNGYFGGKVDTTGGTLTNPTVSGTLTATGNATIGGTMGVTGDTTFSGNAIIGGAVTAPSGSALVLSPGDATQLLLVKNGVAGPILLKMGGSGFDIEPQTNILLPGGTWGSGTLTNGRGAIFQNATFSGSTTSPTAAFGAWLQQTDNSSNTNASGGVGLFEHLILNGSGVIGGRTAGQFTLDINAATGNSTQQQYVALGSKCNLDAIDPAGATSSTASICFGANPVASIGAGVTANGVVGTEVDTWVQSGAVVKDRIGLQVVDVTGSTYGTQGSRDDVALSLNNQYGPSSSLGFKVGLEFGRSGGFFPVATNGTMIYGQGNVGGSWTVANGIDWSLGTATGYWLKLGSVASIDGSGNVSAASYKVGSTAGVSCAAGTVSLSTLVVTNGIVTHC